MSGERQQLALLPDDPTAFGLPPGQAGPPRPLSYSGPVMPAAPIRTSGQTEYAVECTGPGGCGERHRHVSPGVKKAPCGAEYAIPHPDEETPP